MRLITADQFVTQPWKNGGGVTHEIAREDRDGQLLWRLSIAEVASDGPFSAFPGLTRILTVIAGAGLHLHTPEGCLEALPYTPVRFSGDTAIDSRLIDGPVRDFNLIWDAARLSATVQPLDSALPDCPPAPGRRYALLALTTLARPAIPAGAVAFFDQAPSQPAAGFQGLLVTIEPAA
ncbi:HutD family protein [Frigidibacter sp. RF13]|uniref:HutD/Ves family protein n=1 Tax=Frigidibacter sp. RF13 TaxID=2997340 RepID=UPI00226D9E99|nr:HutD family protein [Frigidibacter sp. RF13]MCY1127386.1 HutD family protein [Frigidibacter sp. RF13]